MASFIIEHMEEILTEWDSFARTLSPASATMDSLALRDHARQMLEAIAKDIGTRQSEDQKELKSKGLGPVFYGKETAAASHGALRFTVGFDLPELVAEFRALRATVLRLWVAGTRRGDPQTAYEMARFNEAIDQALAESIATYSEELGKSRDTFLAILGHDLRSPLAALAGMVQVVSTSDDAQQRAKALASGSRSVSYMSAMIRDLLEYTRTRLGKGIPISPGPANLEAVCHASVNEVSMGDPHLKLEFESSGDLDATFDITRMQQVFSNLLNNAAQHGKRGQPIRMSVRGDEDSMTVQVRNEGETISAEALQVIFDPLVQLDEERTESTSTNLGLGLFIARQIVLAHGGTIEVESSPTGATTFTVALPRTAAAALPAKAAARAVSGA